MCTADAVASFLVTGKSEDDCEKAIQAVDVWFNQTLTVYQPMSGAAAAIDSKDSKSAPAPVATAAAAGSGSGSGGEDRDLVYADTLRLTSTAVLNSYLNLIRSDPIFGALAVVITQSDVTPFEGLVATAEWEAFYRSVWEVSSVPAINAQESRFVSLLEAVEGGAAYRPPGHAVCVSGPVQTLLRSAIQAQRKLLKLAIGACDAEMAPQKAAAEFIMSSFDVFGDGKDPYVLLANIDQL